MKITEFGVKRSWPNACNIAACLEGLKKTTKILSQGIQRPGPDSNRAPPVNMYKTPVPHQTPLVSFRYFGTMVIRGVEL